MAQRLTLSFLLLLLVATQATAGVGAGKTPADPLPPTLNGGPDAWGYTWIRSDSGGPAFNWIDITTIGTLVTGLGDDNNVGPFSIGYNFQYYWYTVSQFRIGSNGYLSFGNQAANFAAPFAQMPSSSPSNPKDMLVALGGDLDFSAFPADAKCYYWTNGVDSTVVSYIDVTEWQAAPNANFKHTFQIILDGADSSITFQYGEQEGTFSGTNNQTLCIGIENQTGTIGLSYAWEPVTPTHPRLPFDGLAVKYKRTVNTGLQVTDAGVVGGFDAENQGVFFQENLGDTVKCVVKNFGTVDLSDVSVTYAISRTGQTTARDTVFLASLLASEESQVVFPRLFSPLVRGSFSATFTATVTGDIGPANNTKVAEIRAVDFSPDANTYLAFDDNVNGGSINWLGGTGGMAVDFQMPVEVEQVRIESVYVDITTINPPPPTPVLTVDILDGSSGAPGAILGTRTVSNAVVGNNRISFVSDSIRITSGRFFVSAKGNYAFSYELTAPIAYRTWEFTNGYAPYRSRDLQDILIRASVRMETPAPPPHALADSGLFYATTGSMGPNPGSLLIVDPTYGTGTLLGSTGIVGDNGLSVPGLAIKSTGEVYGVSSTSTAGLYQIDAVTGTGFFVVNTGLDHPQALAFDGNDILYAVDANNDLYTVDPQTGATTLIGATGATIASMEFDPTTGVLYGGEGGAGGTNDGIYTINFTTGTATLVGHTGLGSNTPAIEFDELGNLYGAVGGEANPNQLAYIDKTTGVGTVLGDIGFQDVQGMSTRSNRIVLGVKPPTSGLPAHFNLAQNFPNPFNPSTIIHFDLPEQADVTLRIFNVLGQEITTLVDDVKPAGYHAVKWNGTNRSGLTVASGLYFYRLEARSAGKGGTFTDLKKMVFVK